MSLKRPSIGSLFAAWVGLNLFDLTLTAYALPQGAVEVNPFLSLLIGALGSPLAALILWKTALIALVFWCLIQSYPEHKVAAYRLLTLADCLMLVVVALNTFTLLRYTA